MRYAVIDLETTGFSPLTDRVVEMACVLIEDRAILRTWSTLVNPERPIPEYATRVHGITDADVACAPSFTRAQLRLFNLCQDAVVVAHNATFDLSFLPLFKSMPSLCTLQLARRFFPNAPNHKNQTLRDYLSIDALLSCHAEVSPCHAEVSKHGRGIEANLRPHRAPPCHAEVSKRRRGIEAPPCHARATCHAEVSKHGRGIEANLHPHRALSDALVTAGILLRCLETQNEGRQPYPVRKSA